MTAPNSKEERLAQQQADIALRNAAERGNAADIRRLLQDVPRANVNAEDRLGRTPSWHAACHGRSDCLEALFEAGADLQKVDKNEVGPIYMANANGHMQAIRVLNTLYKRPFRLNVAPVGNVVSASPSALRPSDG